MLQRLMRAIFGSPPSVAQVSGRGGAPVARQAGPPTPDAARRLELFKYDSCPYCRRVTKVLTQLEIEVELRDTLDDPGARAELAERTGRTQVPCLFIDGVPMFESADINQWLRAYAKRDAAIA